MKTSKHPFLPLTRVAQGQSLEAFESAFDDSTEVSYSQNLQETGLFSLYIDWKQYSRQRRLLYTVGTLNEFCRVAFSEKGRFHNGVCEVLSGR